MVLSGLRKQDSGVSFIRDEALGDRFSQDLVKYYTINHLKASSDAQPAVRAEQTPKGRITYLHCKGNTTLHFDLSLYRGALLDLEFRSTRAIRARISWIDSSEHVVGDVVGSGSETNDRHTIDLADYEGRDGFLALNFTADAEFQVREILVWGYRDPNPRLSEVCQCPVTGKALRLSANGDAMETSDGAVRYSIHSGMACFHQSKNGPPAISDNFIRHSYYDRVRQMLSELPANGLAIDIGAGYNVVKYRKLLAYDVQNFPTTDVMGEGLSFPFRDETFDLVVTQQVMEHVTNPYTFAEEMFRILKPGGRVFLTTAFMQGLHGYPYHYCNLTKYGVQEVMKQFSEIGCGPSNDQKAWRALWNSLGLYSKHMSPDNKEDFLSMTVRELLTDLVTNLSRSRFAELENPALNDALAASFTFLGQKPIGSQAPVRRAPAVSTPAVPAAESDPKSLFKSYKGYQIPRNLIDMTGGGADTWEGIIANHLRGYAKWCPLKAGQHIVEIGCGVGRDAIPLSEIIGPTGSYLGVDVIKESIEWCKANITAKHPNFKFVWYDIWSQGYNPKGTMKTQDISLPITDGTVDRFILQSVFTHLFEADVTHYLKEFSRGLSKDGIVYATCFVADEEALALAKAHSKYKFLNEHGNGVRINDAHCPENAVAFTRETIDRMLKHSGLALMHPIDLGSWCGGRASTHFQDLLILKKA